MPEATQGARRTRLPAPARRSQLLDVAEAVLAEHGGAASMDAIAARAGVTKPVLYRHFRDKDALLAAVAERRTSELAEVLEHKLLGAGDVRTRTQNAIEAYLALVEQNEGIYRLLTRQAALEAPGVAMTILRFTQRLADDLAETLVLNFGLTDELAPLAPTYAYGIVGMVHNVADYWLEHRHVDRRTLAAALTGMAWGDYGRFAERLDERLRSGEPPVTPGEIRSRRRS